MAVSEVSHSAESVGNAFARQYYTILQHSPALVYRFYQDLSKFGRADNNGEVMGCTTTMDAINKKILSYGSLKADVKFVDAQESYDGGVIVLVNGSMVNQDDSRQKFNQTFFLAPQDKGYYVLNDIFRYVTDDDADINVEQNDCMALATPSQDPPEPESHIPELANEEVDNLDGDVDCRNREVDIPNEEAHNPDGEVDNPNEEVDNPNEEVQSSNTELPVEEVKKEVHVEEEERLAEVVDIVPQESWVDVESSAKVKDTPKKSYASIVMKDVPATMLSSTHPKSVTQMQYCQVPVASASISIDVPTSSSNEEISSDGNYQVPEGKSHSVCCRNLPMKVPYSVVKEVFQSFGPIKNGGIQVRHYVGFAIGFVEFETAAAALCAIKASPITMDGREVSVEEKKSTAFQGNSFAGNNRGRYPPGRAGPAGSSFRGEVGRGRGGYGRGRGYGRGENNDFNFGGRGGGRGYQNRDEGYPRADHTRNGYGRMTRGGWLAHEGSRSQRVMV